DVLAAELELAHPVEQAFLWARPVQCYPEILASPRTRKESERRVECLTKLVGLEECVPEIVRVLEARSVTVCLAGREITGRAAVPAGHGQVPVAPKFRRLPDAIETCIGVVSKAGGVTVRDERSKSQVFADVVSRS